jgi:cysteinyl-tRNA synthetase
VFSDLIARVLGESGYRVRRVINITDVGHLVSDADEGEDKMEKSAREAGATAADIAERYTKLFLEDIRALNLDTGDILFPRATEYIKEQIALIKTLEEKGLTYEIRDGIYFDTTKFSGYGKLGGISKKTEARIEENAEKRSPADFALWKFSAPGEKRQQEWDSPWGRGFPGWHIECSAMSKALLGETLDIHTGGIDHIPTHHNNEIAQSEAANGKPFVRYFMHGAFLNLEGERFAKSENRVVYLSDIIERGIHPLALRYLFLQAHYRSPLSFSWESLEAANEALTRLWRHAREFKEESRGAATSSPASDRITALLRDDLSTPAALALLWETVRDDGVQAKTAWGVIKAADSILGLSLIEPPFYGRLKDTDIPEDVQKLIASRQQARQQGDFKKADGLRIHIQERGYDVDDRPEGAMVTRRPG